jgi:hypothetical protein
MVWQVSIPEIVAKDQLSVAIDLNGSSLNVTRAIVPAIGGFIHTSLEAFYIMLIILAFPQMGPSLLFGLLVSGERVTFILPD